MRKPKGKLIKKIYLGEHEVEFYYHSDDIYRSNDMYQIDVYIDGEKEDEIQPCAGYDLTDYDIVDWYSQGMRKIMDKYD